MKNLSQDLIKAFKKIDKYGKSEITIDTYIRYICIDRNSLTRLKRNLAFAELMSRLAPDKEINQWYVAGLLNDICKTRIPGMTDSSGVIKALLAKAEVDRGTVYAVENFRKLKDPRRWTPLIAALNYVDTHIEADGSLLTTEECCSLNSGLKSCNECMYARYYFSRTDMHIEAESRIEKLKAELEDKAVEKGKEDANENRKGRMAEGSQKANAVTAG